MRKKWAEGEAIPSDREEEVCRGLVGLGFLKTEDPNGYPERGVKERSRQLPRNCATASGERLGNTSGAGMKSWLVR